MSQTFTGSLTHEDSKQHIEHRFTVPAGTTRLVITFDHSPQRAAGAAYDNQVSLSLFDPNGSRGARHNNADQTIRLSRAEATPGYIPGDLPPGEWAVVVDTHRILPPDPLTYTIAVTLSDVAVGEPLAYTPGTTAPRGAGWYRGDLHGHTFHSDGSWDVPDFFQYGKDYGLDFVTLTDHNTVSGLAQLDSLRDDDLLTMGGMELTTYHGHALALGTRQWHEWRTTEARTITDLARAITASGALFIIAHPMSEGDPACTGCRWAFHEMTPGIARVVEVWNGVWRPYNQESLDLYYRWLNAGHRLVATTGTDIHGKPPVARVRGAAANVVYADELSEAAILDGIRAGHLYLSGGPIVTLTAASDSGETVMMGDLFSGGEAGRVNAVWTGHDRDDVVRFMVNGAVRAEVSASQATAAMWEVNFSADRWWTVELRAADGTMRALTNPIFAPTFGT